MWHRSAIGVLALIAGCSEPASPIPPEPDRAIQELDILEAVYRHQFEHNASSATALDDVDVFFLSLGEDLDPPLDLLSRFAKNDPLVAPISAEDEASSRVTHESTGGRGIILRVKDIRWIDGDTVEADGGYWEASLSSSGNTYRLERKKGKCIVVDDKLHWIS